MNRKEKPVYRQIKEQMLQEFLETEHRVGDRLPTEAELALTFGVSRSTVKRALASLVEEGLVEQVIGSGTYVLPTMVNLRQQHLSELRGRRVALIVPEIADRYSYRILRGVCAQVEEYQYDFELYNTFNSVEKEEEILRRVLNAGVDGIILWPAASFGSPPLLRELVTRAFPLVLIDHRLEDMPCHGIMSDHRAAGFQATTYLLERGHTHIGFFNTQATMVPSQWERLQGYRMALEKWGVPALPSLQETALPPVSDDTFTPALRAYFERNPTLTAALCGAGLVMRTTALLKDMGKAVPQDVSLLCFDGLENAKYFLCPPTHIRQSEKEIGREAVRMLARLFRHPIGDPQVLRLPVSLVEGATVCARKKVDTP